MSRYIGGQIGDVQEPNNRYAPGELRGVFSASDQYQMRKGGGWAGVKGMQCEGGDAVNDYIEGTDVYRAHIFFRDGKFKVHSLGAYGDEIEYLVVAGGGAGGGSATTPGAGGGGGGGVRIKLSGSPMNNPAAQEVFVAGKANSTQAGDGFGTYTVRVGRGGRSSPGTPPSGSNSNSDTVGPGQPSYFGPPSTPEGITATGGGGGGAGYNPSYGSYPSPGRFLIYSGRPGGSGGGGGGDVGPNRTGGYGNTPPTSPSQGSNGGDGSDQPGSDAGGGGGGATASGSSVQPGSQLIGAGGGDGLTGVNIAPGFRTSFGGGGGGGSSQNQSSSGPGGNGGGGSGSYQPAANAAIGERFSGGGGGGGSNGYNGKEGGSGCVIIRYKIGTHNLPGNVKATGGMVAVYAPDDLSPQRGKVVHTFVSSGTFVANQNIQNMECLIIGGGGGGGAGEGYAGPGGGGGAGAVIYKTGRSVTAGSHTVTVGNGGEPRYNGGPGANGNGYKGADSVFDGLTATGGGYGGGYLQLGGTSGSAGGNGNGNQNAGSSAATANPGSVVIADEVSPDNGWGYSGGSAATYNPSNALGSGGGGGAAASGTAGTPSAAGNGGNGVAYTIVGQGIKWYAGGGGGAHQSGAGTGGKGGGSSDNPLGGDGGAPGKAGNYGGGVSYVPGFGMGQDGQMTTGSGGGGGFILSPGTSWLASGGAGGPGIVVIAYPSD
tara:strand:+ start:1320 stop:3452 length:2133 start_codon:yes stop_codon:yes gene_type:complete